VGEAGGADRGTGLRMRIAFLLPMSLESPSGLRYSGMAKALQERGHQVTVLALHHDLESVRSRYLEVGGVQLHYVGQMHVRKVGNHKSYYSPTQLLRVALVSTWQLMKWAACMECDLVHLGKPQPINGLAGLLGGRLLRRRPLFLDCDDYEAVSNRFANPWLRRVIILFEDGLPRFTSGLTVNTRFSQARYVQLGVDSRRIAYVPNGIDRARFEIPTSSHVEALRRRWEVQGRKIIAYIGSMSLTNHSVALLLNSFALLLSRHQNVVLLLVGGGEDYDALQDQAKSLGLDRVVRFVGRVPPADTPAYFALADVTVDPVHDDLVARARSPLKIVESLAVGTPVVTGDVGDRRDMLADGEAGILVKAGDAHALAEGMTQVLENPDLAESLSQTALVQREGYYWENLIDPVIALYEGAS
jgi:glycosyltransferase involved in cell wall biosynthesis